MDTDRPQKPCRMCGDECAGQPRIRDPAGHYYHNACYEKAKLARQSRREAADAETVAESRDANLVAEMLDEVIPEQAALEVEPADDVPQMESAAPMLSAARSRQRFDSGDIVRQEYVKPIVLIVAGVMVALITISSGFGHEAATSPAPAESVGMMSATGYLVGLVVNTIFNTLVFWLASKLWIGDLGPIHLIALRLGGIYAVSEAVAVLSQAVTPSGGPAFACFGLLAAIACLYGLTAWLFDLDFIQMVVLIISIIAVKLIGLAALVAVIALMG